MKERHIRLELQAAAGESSIGTAPIRAVGWNLAQRAQELHLEQGSIIDVAYRIRENDHPEYGGQQIELAGLRTALER